MLIYLNAWFFHYTGNTILFEIAEEKSIINLFQSLVVLFKLSCFVTELLSF